MTNTCMYFKIFDSNKIYDTILYAIRNKKQNL